MSRFERLSLRAARMLAIAGFLLLLAFAGATVLDGLLRSLVGMPIDMVRDVGGLFIAVAVSAGFPFGFLEGCNVIISFIDGLIARRVAAALTLLAAIVVLIVMTAFFLQFAVFSSQLARVGEMSPMLNIRVAPFWFAVTAMLGLTAFAQALVVVHLARRVWQGKPAYHQSITDDHGAPESIT